MVFRVFRYLFLLKVLLLLLLTAVVTVAVAVDAAASVVVVVSKAVLTEVTFLEEKVWQQFAKYFFKSTRNCFCFLCPSYL